MRFVHALPLIFCLAACTPQEWQRGPMAHTPSGQLNMAANRLIPVDISGTVTFASGQAQPASWRIDAPQNSHYAAKYAQAVKVLAPADDRLKDARLLVIKRALRAEGLRSDQITEEEGYGPEGVYALRYVHTAVIAPDCPHWSGSSSDNYLNQPFSNAGCPNVTNMGQMVADPNDLYGHYGNTVPDPDANSAVIGQYKSGKDFRASAQAGGGSSDSPAPAASGAAAGAASAGAAVGK